MISMIAVTAAFLVISLVGMASLLAQAEMVYPLCDHCNSPAIFWHSNMFVWARVMPFVLLLFWGIAVARSRSTSLGTVLSAFVIAARGTAMGLCVFVVGANIWYFSVEFLFASRAFDVATYLEWLPRTSRAVPKHFAWYYNIQ